MRVESELKPWQKAGWTREPRNGREWRMLRAGMSQPKEQVRVFRCRKYPNRTDHRNYRTEYQDGREVRRCTTCQRKNQKAFYERNKPKQREWSRQSKKRRKEFVPEWEDGVTTVSASWMSEHPVLMAELASKGTVVVEVYGEPAYAVISLEKARKL